MSEVYVFSSPPYYEYETHVDLMFIGPCIIVIVEE